MMRALEQCLITCDCIASRLREAPWWPVAPAPYPLGDSLADSEGKAVPSTVVEVMVTHGTGVREPGHPLFIAKLGGSSPLNRHWEVMVIRLTELTVASVTNPNQTNHVRAT